jgi:hypothetical protein
LLLPAEERPHEVEDEADGEAALQLSTRSDATPAACLSPAIPKTGPEVAQPVSTSTATATVAVGA